MFRITDNLLNKEYHCSDTDSLFEQVEILNEEMRERSLSSNITISRVEGERNHVLKEATLPYQEATVEEFFKDVVLVEKKEKKGLLSHFSLRKKKKNEEVERVSEEIEPWGTPVETMPIEEEIEVVETIENEVNEVPSRDVQERIALIGTKNEKEEALLSDESEKVESSREEELEPLEEIIKKEFPLREPSPEEVVEEVDLAIPAKPSSPEGREASYQLLDSFESQTKNYKQVLRQQIQLNEKTVEESKAEIDLCRRKIESLEQGIVQSEHQNKKLKELYYALDEVG